MSVDSIKIKNMLLTSAQNILKHVDELTKLDCELGDGDHGNTMEKIANAIVNEVNAWTESTNAKEGLESLNDTIEDISGGSAAPLFGSFICGMAEAADPAEDTDSFIKATLLGAYDEFYDTSGAKPGGKSMMDAIYPATEVIRNADTITSEILADAAKAARKGSEDTKEMLGKYGRARYIGERSLGHTDPGSVSFALFYEGLSEGYII
ncbi:MAG: dihydroxyacetone kinase subunit L [Eubacterium sp.]